MTEEDKFEVMVKTLVQEANDGNEEVDSFEDTIMESGKGWAGFITRNDPDRVDFYQNHTLYTSPRETYAFYAEYYDGHQAPFPVCEWNASITELEALLQSCSINLYAKYVAECKECLNDHKFMEFSIMEVEEIARKISESLTLPGFTMHAKDYIHFSSYDNGMSPEECFDEFERGNKLGPYAEDAESEE